MAEKQGASIANMPWWELLRDEELQKLIRVAIDENKDLRRAIATMEEFQARLFIARTDFAPQMSATVNAPAFGRDSVFLISRVSQPLQLLYSRQSLLGARHLGQDPSFKRGSS